MKVYVYKFSSQYSFKEEEVDVESTYLDEVKDLCNVLFIPFEMLLDLKMCHNVEKTTLAEFVFKKHIGNNRPTKKPILVFSSVQTAFAGFNNASSALKYVFSRHKHLSFWNNSSIWIRYIDLSDELVDIERQIKSVKGEFKKFHDYYLFNNISSIEVLHYQCRVQKENYLKSFSTNEVGHSSVIFPLTYQDELNSKSNIEDLDLERHPEIKEFNKVEFRILLIDDNLDKGKAIYKIMSLELFDTELKEVISSKIIWKEDNIVLYNYNRCSNTLSNCILADEIILLTDIAKRDVQIIQVKSIVEAIYLLSQDVIKFDLIFIDYLLGKIQGKREIGTTLLEWLKADDGNNASISDLNVELNKIDNVSPKGNLISELRIKAKANRGPLNKFWILPITAFNQTFVDDLISKEIRLIDYYWHISTGADPITTPFLFLRLLNSFLYLQLEHGVFTQNELYKFLERSANLLTKEDLIEENGVKGLINFNAFMSSEYSFFINQFMTRAQIRKDKETSLFAKYIWTNFYTNNENQIVFRLTNYIEDFYHCCAYGSEADIERMILRYKKLEAYIKHHKKEGDGVNEKENLQTEISKPLENSIWRDIKLSAFYEVLLKLGQK